MSSRIHDIKPIHRSAHRATYVSSDRETISRPPVRPPRRTSQRSGGGRGVWYVAILLIVALFFGLSIFFTSATVTITPKTLEPTINDRFVAYKKSVADELSFDYMVVEGEVSETVSSDTKENVEDPARGTVRIFNNHSEAAQPLVIDTRLVDAEGRTYKTVEKVTVPGQKVVDGKTEPGFVDVDIYADSAGPEGNETEVGLSLKIAGFGEAKSPKYETIYAETLTPLSGGFSGERFVVSPEEKEQVMQNLSTKLMDDLRMKSAAQVPATSFIPANLSVIINENLMEDVGESGEIKITLKGSLFNILFNTVEFERYLIENAVVGAQQGEVYIANVKELNISYIDSDAQTVDLESLETLGFGIDDALEVVWNINTDSLKFELVGKKKKDFQAIISDFAGIDTASVNVRPIWRGRLPDNDEDIEVINTIQQSI